METLRSKQIFTYCPNCLYILSKDAIFIIYLGISYFKPSNYSSSTLIKLKLTMSISLHKQLQYKQRDFKSEYLFRTCSVSTNLVTSLEFNSTRCATTLCHFGQTRNGSVDPHFILLSSTVTSSATDSYVAVPERLGQNEEPASGNKKRAINKRKSVTKT